MRISYCHTLDSSSGYYYMHYYVNGPMVLYIVGKRVYKDGKFLYWFGYYSLAKFLCLSGTRLKWMDGYLIIAILAIAKPLFLSKHGCSTAN